MPKNPVERSSPLPPQTKAIILYKVASVHSLSVWYFGAPDTYQEHSDTIFASSLTELIKDIKNPKVMNLKIVILAAE
ncbi:hypothetical protein K4039_00740 [Lyngbya sp. CCAP 1446/10]|uniref:hypothetical protein n=1 Tax=Lyngbya sp. CCAP 1446/10 TaxID=439293 RepID=UPI002238795B|nr:hypothetical protein [Lyngbya sp. CCAP 1446/10]MCW6048640.1 hypothetical protein [Lyngbya sp. CCAP 1446/10]